MISQITLTISLVLVVASLIIQIVFLLKKEDRIDSISPFLLCTAGILQVGTIIYRSFVIHFVAITNMYESLVLISATMALLTSVYRWQMFFPFSKPIQFGGSLLTLFFLALSSSPLAPDAIKPPIPALQSGWLVMHVSLTFIGESFLAVGFVAAILHLTAKNETKAKEFDRLTYTTVGIGYPIFTIGALIFGMIWAENAWGRWWGWDPKETWALITWLTYTAYLHLRIIKKNTGKLMSILVIIGFLLAMFTFFGVNFLLPGLHSYM
jgi:ABC-type transport system involved in cytochrome c biogenesis permease subunit